MPQKLVCALKQKQTAALSTVSDLVKVFDRHKQLTLLPQLVRFTRLGSATETVSVTKPEGSGKASVASNFLYKVPIKPKMSLGCTWLCSCMRSVLTDTMTSMVSSAGLRRSICTFFNCSLRASSSTASVSLVPLQLDLCLPEAPPLEAAGSSPEDEESSAKLTPADTAHFLVDEEGFFRWGVPAVPPKGSCLLACS